jgi:uncharacterized protein with PIN domain
VISVSLALPIPPKEARLGHCVRCAGPLVDVRHPFLERGFLYRAVPAWYCAACGEHYYHVGTINAIQRDAARRLASA